MNEQSSKNTISVVAISLFGKITALLSRTIYMAMFGADNPYLNIYVYALDMPNVIFNCIGTALNTVIIPIYTSMLAKNEKNEGKKFLDNIITISVSIIGILVLLGVMVAPLAASLAAKSIDNEYADYLVFALRILFPVMIFYGLNYIFQGILQSHGRFKLPAFVSAPSGIIIIAYLLLFSKKWGVTGLIFATVIGLFAQPVIMVPAINKLGYKYKFSFGLKDSNVKTAGMLTIPVLASVSSYQLNFLFNNFMALRFGTVALMSYSQNLVQAFMLTIVYAITSVYFPRLSSLWASENKAGYGKTLKELIEYMLFLILPSALGVFILRYDIMDFLLNWKGQSVQDIEMAGNLLGLYSLGIIAISFKEVLDKAFYSAKDTKTPAIYGFVIMAVNIVVTLLLLEFLGPYSMPAAYVISAFCGAVGLFLKADGIVKITGRTFLTTSVKIIAAAILMLATAKWAMSLAGGIYLINETFTKIIRLSLPAGLGASVYFSAAWILKIPAFYTLIKKGNNR